MNGASEPWVSSSWKSRLEEITSDFVIKIPFYSNKELSGSFLSLRLEAGSNYYDFLL